MTRLTLFLFLIASKQSWKMKDAYIHVHVATQSVQTFTSLWELMKERNCSVMVFLDPTPVNVHSLIKALLR